MTEGNNVNDNGIVSVKPNYNDNDNGSKYEKSRQVEVTADMLLDKLNAAKESRPFMCKVAYKLSEARIWGNVEQALKGKNPMGLFIYLCKRDGV